MDKQIKSFIKTLVNIKQKSMEVPGKDKLRKNLSMHFEEHYAWTDVSLILYASFSLKPSVRIQHSADWHFLK